MKPAFQLMFDLRSGEARIGCILAELFEERESRRRELHECFCDRCELRGVFTGKCGELIELLGRHRIHVQADGPKACTFFNWSPELLGNPGKAAK